MKTKTILCLLLLAATALAAPPLPTPQRTVRATLVWNPSPSPNLTAYRLYTSVNNAAWVSNNVGLVSTVTLSNLQAGVSYAFAVSALNTAGLESDLSNVVEAPPAEVPAAPTGLQYAPIVVQVETRINGGRWAAFRTYTNHVPVDGSAREFRSAVEIKRPVEVAGPLPR
jgi:hypothetical protein